MIPGSGLGLAAQREAITEANRRGWDVTWISDDGYTAAHLIRPGIAEAFAALARGDAEAIVVAKLDRLSRSVTDFAATLDLARRQGWALVAMDLGVDTTTPAGELVANVMAAVAQWERRVIQQRTRDALTAAKARGQRLGRPRTTPDAVVGRVVALAADLSPTTVQAHRHTPMPQSAPHDASTAETMINKGPTKASRLDSSQRHTNDSDRCTPSAVLLTDAGFSATDFIVQALISLWSCRHFDLNCTRT